MRLCYGLLLAFVAACNSSTSYSNNHPPPPPPAPPPAPGTTFVTVSDFLFSPDTARILTGRPVRWTNAGSQSHSVVSDTPSQFNSGTLSSAGADSTGTPYAGTTYDRVFASPGTFPYHCSFHPQMKGVVIVSN